MALVDANVLIYAVNTDAPHNERARTWLDQALSGSGLVHFDWVALLAFVRLTTRDGLFPRPLSTGQAFARVDAWLSQPSALVIHPGPDHAALMARLLAVTGAGGNLVNDAHLAALALAHNCPVVSFDHDFARFPGLVWHSPLVAAPRT
ncbi:MAG: PIN domain-containing protein [Actinobacteria bacterium]|nr:PIN domain-containing protein [Actinomycetota bacterium]MCB9411738.1 PIN domain-containing protein [Actinomycetota bacterium]